MTRCFFVAPMNLLMTGMVLTSRFAMKSVEGGGDPGRPQFWFIMSMALIAGFACAYPINWWLVANHMKHGMLTVRKTPAPASMGAMSREMPEESSSVEVQPSAGVKAAMTMLTFVILGAALVIVVMFAL